MIIIIMYNALSRALVLLKAVSKLRSLSSFHSDSGRQGRNLKSGEGVSVSAFLILMKDTVGSLMFTNWQMGPQFNVHLRDGTHIDELPCLKSSTMEFIAGPRFKPRLISLL